jgi:hypothetical protein
MAVIVTNLTSTQLILPLPLNTVIQAHMAEEFPYVEFDTLLNDARFIDFIGRDLISVVNRDDRVDELEYKDVPIGTDYLEIADSEDEYNKKKINLSDIQGTITDATLTAAGLMSALDKTHLEELLAMLDTPAVKVADYATSTGDTVPTTVADGYALPTTGFKETIAFAATITAAGAATITGVIWLWQSLATVAAWYPIRSITLGNEDAVVADTDQLIGGVAEITWPRGVTRVKWQTISETGAPSARNITITA